MEPEKPALFPQTFIEFGPLSVALLNLITERHNRLLAVLIFLEVPSSAFDRQTALLPVV
jgi:hypothetical protein